jgi:2OG-Fe(II) oxygenase superfamily
MSAFRQVALKEPDCKLFYIDNFLDIAEASNFWKFLVESREEFLKFEYKREIIQWSKPAGKTYSFCEHSFIAKECPDLIHLLSKQVKELLVAEYPDVFSSSPLEFNYCLCNYYTDGEGGVSWHTDDEKELIEYAPIACISLGEIRRFGLKNINDETDVVELDLADGSLVVMAGAMQKKYYHSILTDETKQGSRFSLTFRCHH